MFELDSVLDDRYVIKEALSATGTTKRYLVYDQYLKREAELKALLPEFQDDAAKHKIFIREAEVLAQLEHPNIIPIYDLHIDAPSYFVTRHIKDGTVRDLLNKRKLSVREVLALGTRIASAIDYLHAQGIVHRNVSPDNILLSAESHPYILEFGYSKIQNRTDLFSAKTLATIQYAAPELLSDVGVIDHRADIFSFGIVLFECLVGRQPFQDANPLKSSMAMFHLSNKSASLPSTRKINPSLPPGVDVVLNRLTRAEPSERYDNLTDAMDDLARTFYSGQSNIEGTVFISYARIDSEYVYELANELRRVGLDSWIDQDIHPGANWDAEVERALDSCEMLLLIASPASMQSENVQDEWSYFLEEGKPVYTFIYEPVELSFRLRRRQYIESTGDLLTDVSKIVDVLAGGTPSKIAPETG